MYLLSSWLSKSSSIRYLNLWTNFFFYITEWETERYRHFDSTCTRTIQQYNTYKYLKRTSQIACINHLNLSFTFQIIAAQKQNQMVIAKTNMDVNFSLSWAMFSQVALSSASTQSHAPPQICKLFSFHAVVLLPFGATEFGRRCHDIATGCPAL